MRSYLSLLNAFSSEFFLIILRMLSTIYIAKAYGLAILGSYSTLMTWASILALFSVFGGYNLIQKNSNDSSYNKVIKIACLISLFSAIIYSFIVSGVFFINEFKFAFLILFFETINLSLRSISKAFLYSEKKIKILALSNMLIGVSYLFFLIVLVRFLPLEKNSIVYFVISYNLVSFAFFSYGIIKRSCKTKIDLNDVKEYISEALTFLASSSLRNLYQQLDKILVNIFFKSEISGLYNLCSRFATTALLPVNTYIQSIESNFYHQKIGQDSVYSYFAKKKKIAFFLNVLFSIASVAPAFLILKYLNELDSTLNLYILFIPLIIIQGYFNIYLSLMNGQGFKSERIKILFLLNVSMSLLVYVSSFMNIYYTPLFIAVMNLYVTYIINKKIKAKNV
ncbi:oligosaccharide flippase family protein [Superficieibacter sp. HKU1]|uniref:oligosaccharide flippase family protein n=1 Tax=Superficieibacter sp. HKU1 TaxID=3031919 RepID=UPI0023E0F9A1|nr:oligosaccharide flippase family protein [Superficieibacter sp. HKU1]WES66722.1 oligosaccharide flippase family protein [Superficieibacter sp. HKU1]